MITRCPSAVILNIADALRGSEVKNPHVENGLIFAAGILR